MPGKEHRGPKCETGFARAVADSALSRPVILSTEARADVERLHDWLFGKNALAADRLLDVFDEAFESLADISDRGRHADDAGLRELIVPFGGSRYVVRYEVGHDQVRVTRIWHGLEDRSAKSKVARESDLEWLLALPKHAILIDGAPAERATEDAL